MIATGGATFLLGIETVVPFDLDSLTAHESSSTLVTLLIGNYFSRFEFFNLPTASEAGPTPRNGDLKINRPPNLRNSGYPGSMDDNVCQKIRGAFYSTNGTFTLFRRIRK